MPQARARGAGLAARPAAESAKTVGSALGILGLFNHAAPERTVREIAQRLSIPYSTAYRYVTTLEAAGFLTRHAPTGAYRIGLPVIELAGVALNQLDVRVQWLSDLDRLAGATGLNANLAILYRADVLHVAYAVRSEVPKMISYRLGYDAADPHQAAPLV